MTILERYQQAIPDTGDANIKGRDKTPIGDDNPTGEQNPSLDLATDETRLKNARGGQLTSKPYSDTFI